MEGTKKSIPLPTPIRIHPAKLKLRKELARLNQACLTESANYLKNQVNSMQFKVDKLNEQQKKADKIKNMVEKDLQKTKSKLVNYGTEHLKESVNKFRVQQRNKLLSNFQKFLHKKQQEEQKVKKNKFNIQNQLIEKRKINFMNEQKVRLRAQQNYFRIVTKTEQQLQLKSKRQKILSQTHQKNHSFSSIKHSQTSQASRMAKSCNRGQQRLITNYIRKIKKINQNILQKELRSSLSTPIQCRSAKRNQKQIEKCIFNEQKLNQRINKFQSKRSLMLQNKTLSIQEQSLKRQKNQLKVLQKKQMIKNRDLQKIFKQYQKNNTKLQSSRGLLSHSLIDKQNSIIIYYRNCYKNKMQNIKQKHLKKMNYYYNKVKNMGSNTNQKILLQKQMMNLSKQLKYIEKKQSLVKKFLQNNKVPQYDVQSKLQKSFKNIIK